MGALRAPPGDLVEMGLHSVGIGEGHGERRADAACWADRPEQIGALVALIGGLARPRRRDDRPAPLTEPGSPEPSSAHRQARPWQKPRAGHAPQATDPACPS